MAHEVGGELRSAEDRHHQQLGHRGRREDGDPGEGRRGDDGGDRESRACLAGSVAGRITGGAAHLTRHPEAVMADLRVDKLVARSGETVRGYVALTNLPDGSTTPLPVIIVN